MKKLLLTSIAVLGLTVAHGQINPNVSGTGNPCTGQCVGTATSNPSGGTPPYSYTWSPGGQTTQTITGLCNGMYACSVVDAFGPPAFVGAVNITSPNPIAISCSANPTTITAGNSSTITASVSGGTPPYSYFWCTGSTLNPIVVSWASTSSCCVTVIDANGCMDTSCVTVHVNPTSVQDFSNDKLFLISPNPFSSQTVLQTDNFFHNATLTVDNCFGQTVKQIKNISGQTVTLFRDNLPSGLYFIRLTQDDKTLATDKLVITDK